VSQSEDGTGTILLAAVYGSAPEVKTFGGDNQVRITTKYKIEDEGTEARLVESNRISSTSDEVDAFIESAGEHRYQTNNGDNTGYRITHFPSFEEWEVYVPQPVGCKWSGKSDVIIFLGCIVENDPAY